MSVTLNTQLGELMLSSQIPDIDLSPSDDNETVMTVIILNAEALRLSD